MGTALARAFLANDNEVTVWNRSVDKSEPLARAGARVAKTVADAVIAGDVIVICISDYGASRSLLEEAGDLSGKTLVQLTGGMPDEAGELASWVEARGALYLDGAIMVYPGHIGSSDAQILVAGSQPAFDQCTALLDALAGDIRYLGESPRAAAAMDMALLWRMLARSIGTVMGAVVCEVEGASVGEYAKLLPEGERSRTIAERIHAGDFSIGGNSASGNVVLEIVSRFRDHARGAGIDVRLAEAFVEMQTRSIEAGDGEQDAAALVNVLRPKLD